MIELADKVFKSLIQICLMKHKNKQGNETRKKKGTCRPEIYTN